jgi:hypothetical protein
MYHSRSQNECNSLGPKEALALIMALAGETEGSSGPELEQWDETEEYALVPAKVRNQQPGRE